LVGGGSSGLGRACAARLAAEGCRVAIWSRDRAAIESTADDLRAAHGVEVHPIAADARDAGAAIAVTEAAASALGPIDIVVLNAGGPPTVDATATTPDGWHEAFQLLAITPIEMATLLLPSMRARRWGRIVAILSSGVRQPIHELVYSNAGRSALMAWLKTCSRSVIADGVTMNGVLPGRLDTPRVAALDRERAERTRQPIEAVTAERLTSIPAGRYGDPDELAALVAYLCSDPARYQTGTFVAVDGGMIDSLA
ncbi:MAG TPA: SDR family oxidoreductase, partial [Candidatus Limnocylindrales bacterium]